jgi:hypothetical protein
MQAPDWENAKHAQQWRSTLKAHAYPHIVETLVRNTELRQVLAVLEPIWRTGLPGWPEPGALARPPRQPKTEAAIRLRARIKKMLDWATTRA